MPTILHIDSSPRGERSKSRQLAKEFVMQWQGSYSDAAVVYRDLRLSPISHVTEAWIAADYTPLEEQTPEMLETLQLSNELVDELVSADRCVFSVSMYNFSVPSSFNSRFAQNNLSSQNTTKAMGF